MSGDMISRLPPSERGISKLTPRRETGDVGIVKEFGDRVVWLIVLRGN